MMLSFARFPEEGVLGGNLRSLRHRYVLVLCLTVMVGFCTQQTQAVNTMLPDSAGDILGAFELALSVTAEDGECGFDEDFWADSDAPFLNDTDGDTGLQWQADGYTSYNITGDVMLTMATNQIFDEDISADLSILTTVKIDVTGQSSQPLLQLYTEDSDGYPALVLGLDVGEQPKLSYLDSDGESQDLELDLSINDGNWHTVAVSLEGDTVSVYVDCELSETLTIDRDDSDIPYDGLTTVGRTLVGDTYLQAHVQQLVVIPDPDAAEYHCEDYTGCLDGVDGYYCDDGSFLFSDDDTTSEDLESCGVSAGERPWAATSFILTLSGLLLGWLSNNSA